MHEIAGAIIAITFLMAAVFIPVAFYVGTSGCFLPSVFDHDGNSNYSFGIVALTLTCTLCYDVKKQSWCPKKKHLLIDC
jgi:HAE1 family hydrophobic/amphiphilic exporter-1